MKKNYSAGKDFEGCIGITAFENIPIEEIRQKITGYLRDYIETLPLHPSQTLIEKTPYHSVYSYRLRPDNELINIILGLGNCCEILSPQSLREEIHSVALEMAEKNG